MQLACNQFCRPHCDQMESTAQTTVCPYSMCTYVCINTTLIRKFIFTAIFAQFFLAITTTILLLMYFVIFHCNWWHFLRTTTVSKAYSMPCTIVIQRSFIEVGYCSRDTTVRYIIVQDENDVRQLALIDRFSCIIRNFFEWMGRHDKQNWERMEKAHTSSHGRW